MLRLWTLLWSMTMRKSRPHGDNIDPLDKLIFSLMGIAIGIALISMAIAYGCAALCGI